MANLARRQSRRRMAGMGTAPQHLRQGSDRPAGPVQGMGVAWCDGSSPQDERESKNSPAEMWWRQQHAVTAVLEMELACRDLTMAWFSSTELLASDSYSSGAAMLSNLVADEPCMPAKFPITLATATTLSPSNPLTRFEPVFRSPSVTLPPPKAAPKLLSRLVSNPLLEKRPINFEAPPGVETSLQAMPARLGTTAAIAFCVLAGDSPISPEIFDSTSGVR